MPVPRIVGPSRSITASGVPSTRAPMKIPRFPSSLFASMILFSGCAAVDRVLVGDEPAPIDAGWMRYADDDARDRVDEAQATTVAAQDDLAAAKLAIDEAQGDVRVAEERCEVAAARLDVAGARADTADDAEAIEASATSKENAEAELARARARVDLAELVVEQRRQVAEVARREVARARAAEQLERARVVAALERNDTPEIRISEYEAAVRDAQTELEVARARREGVDREVEEATERFREMPTRLENR